MQKITFQSILILLSLVTSAVAEITVTDAGGGMATVYIHDLDLLGQRHAKLDIEVYFKGAATARRIDLMPAWQTPAVLIFGYEPGDVSVVVRGDGAVIKQFEGVVKSIEASQRIALTDKTAVIERGSAMADVPVIHQPDLTKLEPIELGKATRVVEWHDTETRVTSDISFPSIASNNLCAISRQTDHPDDPKRRSMYVSFRSTIYSGPNGTSPAPMNYLLEVPLDPKWLDGSGDKVITLGPRDVKVHSTDRRWPANNPNGKLITGQGKGGLGQGVGTMSLDDAGNIYYSSIPPNHLVRFNIRDARFEAPPIDIQAAMNEHLPNERDQEPKLLSEKRRYFDYVMVCGVSDGRLFVLPVRYAAYGAVRYSGVFSFPLDHWSEAEPFRARMCMLARSWPGSDISLYDYWTETGMKAGQLAPGVVHNGDYYFSSYTVQIPGGPWRIELNQDGSTRHIHPATWEEVRRARQAEAPALPSTASGLIHWWDYGILTTTRSKLRTALYGNHAEDTPLPEGTLTIYYDAIAAIRTDPQRHANLIAAQTGPAQAPGYMLIGVPGESGVLLGVSEKSYYITSYDVSKAAQGVVTKRYLPLDVGESQAYLPTKAGLNPYGRLWWRDGDDLYLILTGYTGITAMRYKSGDTTLSRFKPIHSLPATKSLDDMPNGRFIRERFPMLGMDNRVYLAGIGTVDRGGSPYSSGLGVFTPPTPAFIGRLSHMSRTRETGSLLSRIIHATDGRAVQQFILTGDMSQRAYLDMLSESDRPKNHDAQVYLYQLNPGEEPASVMGFSLPTIQKDGKRISGMDRHVFSQDRRYLVSLQMGRLLSFDLNTWQYVDGYDIDEAALWYPSDPSTCFIQSPNDRTFICVQPSKANTAIFHELHVSPAGELSLEPYLTLRAKHSQHFSAARRGVFAFTPDGSGNGSYDLCVGPYWREPGPKMWVIPDFIEPRQ